MKKFLTLFRVLFIIYIALLLFLTLYSFKDTDISIPKYIFGIMSDKVIHFLMFLPFPFLAWMAFGSYFKRLFPYSPKLLLLLLGLLLASSTEFLQKGTLYRQFDWYDMAANYIAILLGTALIALFDLLFKNVWSSRL